MWRFFLYFHIKKSERKRLIFAFGFPILFWLGYYWFSVHRTSDLETVDYQSVLDSILKVKHVRELALLDSLKDIQPFYSDTTSLRAWRKLGMSAQDSTRLSRYFAAGGAIRQSSDLQRLRVGDSVWQVIISSRMMKVEKTHYQEMSRESPFASHPTFPIAVNHVTDSLLERTGLSPWAKERWMRIVSSGREISTSSEFVAWIRPDSLWFDQWKGQLQFEKSTTVVIIRVNQLDSTRMVHAQIASPWEVMKWKRYGQRLGGYVKLEQLYEAGLDSSTVHSLSSFQLELEEVEKRDLNVEEIKDLARHPYIGWDRARSVEYYRTRVRPIQSVVDLKGLEGWTDRDIGRVSQYFK
ncbi:hypothetical protein [Phaeocystidibacter marisrubri]|uniref:Helix-hairpin-helix domain-containing protein n=1 Tax=Phaeocystidibacter marisrubri TaxID=1577780 RepID=A0A6L3ZJ49_9FLAO|nr:hypothetical protein [Phaeocystidibacter marisrubri]KAB2817190.1 hypothetical protein F8C82_01975 [Phaeocystidibacter marisrubri]